MHLLHVWADPSWDACVILVSITYKANALVACLGWSTQEAWVLMVSMVFCCVKIILFNINLVAYYIFILNYFKIILVFGCFLITSQGNLNLENILTFSWDKKSPRTIFVIVVQIIVLSRGHDRREDTRDESIEGQDIRKKNDIPRWSTLMIHWYSIVPLRFSHLMIRTIINI